MTEKSFNFNSFDIIDFIVSKFRFLLIITVVGAIISIIVSLLIDERYKSAVVLFPASSSSISKALLTDNPSIKDPMRFGEEEEVEQLLQVLQSDEIRSKIIDKYNLMEHYEIEPASKYKTTRLYKKFESNISFNRTEFQSIEIEVLDTDPEIAANIANDIAALLDSTMNRMLKKRAGMAFSIVESEYLTLKNHVQIMEDSLNLLRSFGVNDYESQSEVFNQAYAEAITKGNFVGAQALQQKLDTLSKYGGAYVSIRDFLAYEKKRLSELKAKYAEAKIDAQQELPHKFIVNHAFVAEKKSYPIRWLIVSVSTISTFFMALILLIIIDSLRNRFSKIK